MSKTLLFIYGLILGGVAGVLLAPHSGRRTRSLVRDKAVKYSRDVADYTGGKAKHVANKAKGYAHDLKGVFSRTEEEVQTYI